MEGTNGIPAYFGGAELLEQVRLKMAEDPKDTRRAMDIYLDTFASRDRGEYPRLERDEGDLLGDIYNRPGAEQRHKNLKFLERIAANLEEPDSGEEAIAFSEDENPDDGLYGEGGDTGSGSTA